VLGHGYSGARPQLRKAVRISVWKLLLGHVSVQVSGIQKMSGSVPSHDHMQGVAVKFDITLFESSTPARTRKNVRNNISLGKLVFGYDRGSHGGESATTFLLYYTTQAFLTSLAWS
jgi:hypothetical protein